MRRTWLATGGAVLLVAGLTGGWLLRSVGSGCAGAPLPLSVTAQPEIAPAVRDVADRFNVQDHTVRGRCVRVAVTVRESSLVAASPSRLPDVWIPDSWVWLVAAQRRGGRVPQLADPLATTPVVVAVATANAAGLTPSWKLLESSDFAPRLPDPTTSAPGAMAVAALRKVDAAGLTGFLKSVRTAEPSAAFADFTDLPRDQRLVAAATEQQVFTYNAAHQPNPATPLLPAEGTYLLTYPYAVTATDPLAKQAADAFHDALRSRPAQDALSAAGFRAPDGTAGADLAQALGVPATAPKEPDPLTPALYETALTTWTTTRH